MIDQEQTAAKDSERDENRLILLGAAGAVIILCLIALWPIFSGDLDVALSAGLIPLAFVLVLYMLWRAVGDALSKRDTSAQLGTWTVLLVPAALLIVGSLSSGGTFFSLYEPVAFLILLLCVVTPFAISGVARRLFISLAALMCVCGIVHKAMNPASWISYVIPPLFVHREVIDHPVYGKMVIDSDLESFISGICAVTQDGDPQPELASLPFSYANYYCAIPPWHDYVQTWYDTTSPRVIDVLESQFEHAPPKWILYQRELGALAIHERTFNGGRALPQRALDNLIMSRIATGKWRVVSRQPYGADSDWILMRTRWIGSTAASATRAIASQHSRNLLKRGNGFDGWTGGGVHSGWSVLGSNGIGFAVRTSSAAPVDETLSRKLTFPHDGVVSVATKIDIPYLQAGSGYGYVMDLYDESSGKVVGSIGASAVATQNRVYGFSAQVRSSHHYRLRLQYQAAKGAVRFEDIGMWWGYSD